MEDLRNLRQASAAALPILPPIMQDPKTCPLSSVIENAAVRDPLAVLLLSTDILRQHGDQLSASDLLEQRNAMQVAAAQLSSLMSADQKKK